MYCATRNIKIKTKRDTSYGNILLHYIRCKNVNNDEKNIAYLICTTCNMQTQRYGFWFNRFFYLDAVA